MEDSYKQQIENLHQSLKDVQIVANTVPARKISLQRFIDSTQKSEQQLLQLQSKFEAFAKSLDVKEVLMKKFRTVNQSYKDLLASQTDKVKEAKASAMQDFTKELEECLTTLQTGSIQWNENFRNGFQNLADKDWCVKDLLFTYSSIAYFHQ
jgi:hypothetical protein